MSRVPLTRHLSAEDDAYAARQPYWTWPPRPKATGKSAPNAPTSTQYSQLTRGVELVVIFCENCDPAETSVSRCARPRQAMDGACRGRRFDKLSAHTGSNPGG